MLINWSLNLDNPDGLYIQAGSRTIGVVQAILFHYINSFSLLCLFCTALEPNEIKLSVRRLDVNLWGFTLSTEELCVSIQILRHLAHTLGLPLLQRSL